MDRYVNINSLIKVEDAYDYETYCLSCDAAKGHER
jgi:hypothetical protein